jgi:putative membrane protein
MYWYGGSFIGMSLLWWLFWGLFLVAFFSWATPVPRSRLRRYDEPLDTLRRRYAEGTIATAEYEERRTRLLHDESLDARGARAVFHPTPEVPLDRRRFDRRHTTIGRA